MSIKRVLVAAVVGLAAVSLSTSVQADQVAGPGGAVLTRQVTCSTGSYTVRANTSAVSAPFNMELKAGNDGGVDVATSGVLNVGSSADGTLHSAFVQHPDASAYVTWAGLNGGSDVVSPLGFRFECPNYDPNGDLLYKPITPERVVDTRADSLKNYTGPKPGAGAVIAVPLQALIPLAAVAVLNITLVDANAAGFVQALPGDVSTYGAWSNLNAERAGQLISNTAVVPLPNDSMAKVFTQQGGHILVDVVGYFAFITGPQTEGRFVRKASPDRVLDTCPLPDRKSYNGTKPGPQTLTTFDVGTVAGLTNRGDIAGAILNVTTTEATGPGFVQVGAPTLKSGDSSNMNMETVGQTKANLVFTPVDADGIGAIFTQGGAHLVVDVIGVFSSSSSTLATGGAFRTVAPDRVLDTRVESAVNYANSNGPTARKPGQGSIVPLRFSALPSTTSAVLLNLTGTEATGAGFLQAAALSGLVSGTSSNLNMLTGQTTANAAVVPLDANQALGVFTQSGTHLIADVAGYFTG